MACNLAVISLPSCIFMLLIALIIGACLTVDRIVSATSALSPVFSGTTSGWNVLSEGNQTIGGARSSIAPLNSYYCIALNERQQGQRRFLLISNSLYLLIADTLPVRGLFVFDNLSLIVIVHVLMKRFSITLVIPKRKSYCA